MTLNDFIRISQDIKQSALPKMEKTLQIRVLTDEYLKENQEK